MSYTLIASLGRSPGAITGLLRALNEDRPDGIDISHLHILRTADKDVTRSYELIRKHIRTYDDSIHVSETMLPDDDFFAAQAPAFQKITVDVIQHHIDEGRPIVVGVAGGRTSMGAMLALGAQLYDEVTHVYHFWVSSSIEANGDIEKLNKMPTSSNEYIEALNPPRAKREIVPLPTYGFAKKAIVEMRCHVAARATLELKSAANTVAIDEILQLLPRRMTIEQAERFINIRDDLTEGKPLQEKILVDTMQQAGITHAQQTIDSLKAYARKPGDPDMAVENWIKEAVHNDYYWTDGLMETYRRNREGLRDAMSAVQTTMSVLALGVATLSLHFQLMVR